jgi:hypothetical protein
VHARLDTRNYPKGIEITDQQMDGLERRALRRHDFYGRQMVARPRSQRLGARLGRAL